MNFNPIDLSTWQRKPYFDNYMQNICCTYSITVNLEISKLLAVIKVRQLKLYPTLIYLITTVVNKHQEFRTDFNAQQQLGYWQQINPAYTIFHRENKSFSELWTEYNPSFNKFYTQWLQDYKTFGAITELKVGPAQPANIFPISCVPWLTFTGFNVNVYNINNYLLPIFTIGKFFEQADKINLPLAIQIHHAVCDGYHVSQFVQDLQDMCDCPADWL